MVKILKKKNFKHPDKKFFMNYLEKVNNIPSHQHLYSELRYRVSNLLDEEQYMTVGHFVKNKQRFKKSQWCKGLVASVPDFDITLMEMDELARKVSFVSERKKFISVREGHGEWIDGEFLRGLTDLVFLGIRQIRQNHIEGVRCLGDVFKEFGRKLGYKGLGLIVIGNSLL